MPRPIERDQRYIPGLDGIRALAVLCVIAYHVNLPAARGGMLGVGVFFTLSGYLITDLLLGRWHTHGDLGLGTFWLRRARRLLPALFLMLIAVSVWVALFDTAQLAAVRRQVIAAVFYFNNWSTIAQHGSYFSRFAAPLPLDHLWSLAIEEQFYLVWPWLLLIAIWAMRKRGMLVLLTLAGAAASAVAMGLLFHPGYDPTRVYEGTDTRAFGLLIGAALAIAWPSRVALKGTGPRVAKALDVAGAAGLICTFVLVWRTNSFSSFLYPYGFVLLSLATAATIAAAVNPAGRMGDVLGWEPLRWVGVRSYGIYLWQWPIVVLASPGGSGFNLVRAVLATAAAVLIASLSWRYVEQPIRQGALRRVWRHIRQGVVIVSERRRALAFSSAASGALMLSVVGLAGALPTVSRNLTGAGAVQKLHAAPTRLVSDRLAGTRGANTQTGTPRNADPQHPSAPPATTVADPSAPPATTVAHPTKSSCRSVIYIGDSTSEGSTSPDYLPNWRQRLGPQLADVGVTQTIPEISGARSIVETYQGSPNAATVARNRIAAGYHGCWIIAMGTNDVDDVADGSNVGLSARVSRMMKIIGNQPVMWIDAVTMLASGPYAESGMLTWNRDLVAACQRYSNMRVFDWASWAKPRYFIPDGIHYYTPGYIARTHLIAQALAEAFPQGAPASATCVVR